MRIALATRAAPPQSQGIRNQPKGGDPVSHCSKAFAASAAWITAIATATAGH